ncbi:MAG: multiheme c-type cytochrome [Methylicorpusculum sp.]|uniref:multiheme c-type cytochrome n=1 Tax=Methylicorpusculum sp. TaxID=2713644 RepID=UPI002725FA07|nr:multiheme c-type cytochrome [Methylicorpusculum sp.]MDO8941349.1 multiheme c-type cytochrome [Methylicorpusculum sp.]MDP2202860.1 multiheme c-type cytochrome [Methylicorpusculum sp.]
MKHKLPSLLLTLLLTAIGFSQIGIALAQGPDFEQIKKNYYDSHPGKGSHGKYWEPIPIQKYWNPKDFYTPPKTVQGEFDRDSCIGCHQATTPGAYHAWKSSSHSDLNAIRNLPDSNVKAYKKQKLADVEANLVKQGVLESGQQLSQVGCIDCHGGVGKDKINHSENLVMPDRAACGTCHVGEFAEAESEKEQEWPQKQWGKGHPSHAVDWDANVENTIWAAMSQREVAQGCDMCHYQQNKCDGCHTRHTFSAAEARQPEACATCHNGADHNEFENFMTSKHGTQYQTLGKANWNFEVPLKDAITKGGYTAPTCQLCHFEYKGEFSHNLVRKVRWAFNPTPAIADNLSHPWFEERKQAWVESCSTCHSASFAKAYLDAADKGTIQGLEVEQEAKKVVEKLYKDGLLTGQKTNRPAPPAPEKDAAGGFFQLFWAKGNNPSHVERVYANMWEHDVIKHYKGIFHANPGGFTYTEGWSELLSDYAEIMDEDTRLREAAAAKTTASEKGTTTAASSNGSNSSNNVLMSAILLIVLGLGVAYIVLKPTRTEEDEAVEEKTSETDKDSV